MNDTFAIAQEGRVLDGRYILVRHLADGAMGSVWEAQHLALETAVAVKLIREPRPDWVRRFRRESKVVAQLTSPYVVRVFDYGVVEGVPYFVMERLHGRTMADHLQSSGRPLSPAVTARLVRQIANGLAEAHLGGVVHRDLKPQNIWLLDGAGGLVAKILDFGLATRNAHDPDESAGRISGTPRYMSPEQYDPNTVVDHRSDLWALGAIAYECLTGQPAYPQPSVGALMMAIIQGTRPDPSTLARVPDGFDAWCARAMHQDPAERFQSATEAAEALTLVCDADQAASAPQPLGDDPLSLTAPMPATPTLPDVQQLRTNLVSMRSSFVGRRDELDRLASCVSANVKLITLLGPAGAGKTRLAREFGLTQQASFPGGVWFVDLTEATNLDGLLTAMALALDVPVGSGDPATRLGYALAGRGPTLLIIDNFEQIVDEASEIVARWSVMAPEASMVITSRERLRLDGETVVEVDPQSRRDAIQLFADRAREVSPHFSVNADNEGAVGAIVDQLDCLPLAIELAAARMRMLSLDQLATRLAERFRLLRGRRRDQGTRQSTMRGAIDWSWALLNPEERLTFVQLSAFHGGFDIEALDAVVRLDALPDSGWPDEIVEALVEKSLVRSLELPGGERRFMMLESMRAYAAEKLATPDAVLPGLDGATLAAEVRQGHRNHYGALGATNVASSLYIAGGAARRAVLSREQANLEAAISSGQSDGDPTGAARAWLARFWGVIETRGPYAPAAESAAALLAGGGLESDLQARLELGAATACRLSGDWRRGIHHCDAGLALARTSQDHGLCVSLRQEKGTCLLSLGELDAALVELDAAVAMARRHRLRRLEGIAVGARAEIYFWQGDPAKARAGYDESVHLLHAVGERRFFARAVGNRAVIEYEMGDLESARAGFKVALTFSRRLGYRRGESDLLANVALVEQAEGRYDQAIRGQEAALRIDREGGNRPSEALRMGNLGVLLTEMGRDTEAELKLNAALTLAGDVRSPLLGVLKVYLALLAGRRGDFAAAETQLAVGESILASTSQTELAKATCIRGQIAVLAGDLEAARAAGVKARTVGEAMQASPRSELGRALSALEQAIIDASETGEENDP